jgi:hypothetical protein
MVPPLRKVRVSAPDVLLAATIAARGVSTNCEYVVLRAGREIDLDGITLVPNFYQAPGYLTKNIDSGASLCSSSHQTSEKGEGKNFLLDFSEKKSIESTRHEESGAGGKNTRHRHAGALCAQRLALCICAAKEGGGGP